MEIWRNLGDEGKLGVTIGLLLIYDEFTIGLFGVT